MRDIVERLRDEVKESETRCRCMCHEAAAEIERLRARVAELEASNLRWHVAAMEHYPPNWAHDGRPETIIKNIVFYHDELVRRWAREAEATRAFLTESGGVVPSPEIAHHWNYRDARDENERAEKELERERQIAESSRAANGEVGQ